MCDTFVALPGHTADGSVIFGKNSDRPPNEAQALEHYPARDHAPGAEVSCTHARIPQARHTHAVLICRPHWMWGAEMGANEHGVVIGNEAVFTRIERSRGPGLTGMDLLRLALERAGSAHDALLVIADLLERHGQGGSHGPGLDYHSSFILADPAEAWVLETAGELWAAVRVRGAASISNALTIGEEFDEAHPAAADIARRRGLLRPGETLHFARNFSDRLYTRLAAGRVRRARTGERLSGCAGRMAVTEAFAILRDHGEAGTRYQPDRHLLMRHVCAHAANALTRDAAQTTGSLVAHMRGASRTFWATGTSAPCTSVFKPIWFDGSVLPPLGPPPGPRFDPAIPWWHHERVHRLALRDLARALAQLGPERDGLERRLLEGAGAAASGRWRFSLTETAFRECGELDTEQAARLAATLPPRRARPPYRSYWRRRNAEAGMPVEE
jgi:secernin